MTEEFQKLITRERQNKRRERDGKDDRERR